MHLTNFHFYLDKNYLYSKPVKGLRGFRVGYGFAFNGQEKDDEVAGAGNTMTAEFWQYDSRLGRRWNIDPVVKVFESPYATFGNNPILLVDRNGADTCFSDDKTRTNVLEQVANNKDFATIFQKLVDDKKTTYKFSQWDNSKEKTNEEGTKYQVNGEVSYICKEDNKDVIEIGYTTKVPHYMPDLFPMYEETYHALQFQQGRFGFKTDKDKAFGLDLGDEADAKIWAAKSIPGTIKFTEGSPYLKKTREKIIIKLSQETAYEGLGIDDVSAMQAIISNNPLMDPKILKDGAKRNGIRNRAFRYEE